MGTATVLRGSGSVLVSEPDVTAFAGGVTRVLRDPVLQASLSAAGHRDAAQWSRDTLMRQVVQLYAGLRASVPGALPCTRVSS